MLKVVLDELSEIAHGVHPTVLSQGGLRPALKGLARRSAVPVQLDIRAERRLPEHVELCAYYVIAEALTNTAKHAAASEVHVNVVADDEVLRIEVRDNGRGGANIEGGSGIVGLKDRVDALGGFPRPRQPTRQWHHPCDDSAAQRLIDRSPLVDLRRRIPADRHSAAEPSR